ncbi:BTAD domain-containing putative transcriptional regulator [Kibdelosporangium lantanae]
MFPATHGSLGVAARRKLSDPSDSVFPMRFGVLGPLAVWTADGREVRVPEAKVRMLLAALLVAEGSPVSADRLAFDLWGDRPPGNPANTLQTKVSQLRKALEDAEPGGRKLVAYQSPGYVMKVDVDVAAFRDLVGQGDFDAALALWRGPVLGEFADSSFAVPYIQRLTEERLAAWEEWAVPRLSESSLLGEIGELVARYPLRERLRGLRMRALYLAGRQGEALVSYAEFRRLLAEELGVEPGPELAALHQAILTRTFDADGSGWSAGTSASRARTSSGWRTLPGGAPRSNLPAPLTRLVGRDAAVESVRAVVGESRLVTLIGPGGVGKTRLAIETAGRVGNAWLVEFAGHEQVWEATAASLGVRDDDLVEALRDRDMLLVLDNCERVVAAVADLVSRLSRAAPGLRVLATSREPLGLAGEVLWNVPALEVPAQAVVDVRGFSAVELFLARATDAGYVYESRDAASVAAICRRLDGIPLALELAATRVRALGVAELLDRLSDRFRLLDNGSRDAPARQRTLRAMIDWSWDSLSVAECAVLRRLAVHVEGCDLAAAEVLCAGGDVRREDVLGVVAGLVDRSLVSPGPRYRLLESVAAYGVERLAEAGELAEARLRHAVYYVELAERADPLLRTAEQRTWLERLDAETANLRQALETVRADSALSLRLVNALAWYWFLRGRLGEARRSLRQALSLVGDGPRAYARAWLAGLGVLAGEAADPAGFAAAEEVEDPGARARALWFLGYVTATMGDRSSEHLTEQALTLFVARGDQWGVAAALDDRATQWTARGDFESAERDAAESAALFEALGERWGQLQSSFTLGMLAQTSGDYARAAELHREGLRVAEELGLWTEVSYQLSWLGRTAMGAGDYARAWDLHSRAMRLGAEQGFKPAEMYAETGLGLGARREGKVDVAEKHLTRVLDWHRAVGFEAGSSLILAELGFVAEARGDVAEAWRWQLAGFRVAWENESPRAVALALEGLAGAAALSESFVDAARLLGAAARTRESVGRPLPTSQRGDVDRIAGAARKALGTKGYAEAFEQGRTIHVEELVAEVGPTNVTARVDAERGDSRTRTDHSMDPANRSGDSATQADHSGVPANRQADHSGIPANRQPASVPEGHP